MVQSAQVEVGNRRTHTIHALASREAICVSKRIYAMPLNVRLQALNLRRYFSAPSCLAQLSNA